MASSDRFAVTPERLTAMLREAGAVGAGTVVDVRATAIGTGQAADSLRCELTYDVREPEAPGSVIVKVAAADETSRQSGMIQRLYEREVRFYQQLAQELPIRTPACLFADLDVPTGEFVLVLEDLSPSSPVNQLSGFTVDHASLAMSALSGLHGPRWGSPSLRGFDWLHGVRDTLVPMQADLVPMLAGSFIERYQDRLAPRWLELIGRFQPHMRRFALEQPGPWSVQHGDYRPDNMLFGAKGGAVPFAVVDWQTAVHGPALVDAAYLLGTSLEPEERGKHERELLSVYYEGLLSHGVQGYSWDDCWRDYRYYSYYSIFFLTAAAVLVEQTERGDEMFLTMISRAAAQVTDLEAESLLHS